MKTYKNLIFVLFLFAKFIYGQTTFSPAGLVDPFIGTAAHGHTYPGATLPFGMVQLSPDTRTQGWDWCSGYHSSDNSILGFSHTHLSGTGGADYGDILFMPTSGEIKLQPGEIDKPLTGYRSRFEHSSESAQPGYYSVFLSDYNIKAELTVTKRTGFHKYTFPKTDKANVILDLVHGISDVPEELNIKIIDNNKIEGYRKSNGWANEHTVYFYAEFNKPFIDFGFNEANQSEKNKKTVTSKVLKAFVRFNTIDDEIVLMKIGISHTSIAGAKNNLMKENPGWNFSQIRKYAFNEWNRELSKIKVEGSTKENQIIFYTAFYHSLLTPNLMSDVDGYYYGMDRKIHQAKDYEMYTVFSLWDTFRALHPLLTIIDKKRTRDFVLSLFNKYKENKLLPVWELASNETNCMIGYHSVPVIVDAIIKNVPGLNETELFEAMKTSAMQDNFGINFIKQMGYVPMDRETDATSRTLEYSFDDWCIAQIAKRIGKTDDYDYFLNRSLNYRNVFNEQTGFMQGRRYNGEWKKNFNPSEAFGLGVAEFTEGSAWQYSWFVPHNIFDMIQLFGGRDAFDKKLDELFSNVNKDENLPSDMTGLVGQYVHGNEPSHHIAYLYNYAGYPYKTQEKVRYICENLYKTGREGLCGNEDCGQMSAWYVFSSMGFYPVTPGSNYYAIGSPLFDKVTINLENKKIFTISAKNNSKSNYFIKSAKLNGKKFNNCIIKHSFIENGNKLEFEMSNIPEKNWGLANDIFKNLLIESPKGTINQNWLYIPSIENERRIFNDTIRIKLDSKNKDAEIRYTLNGKIPDETSAICKSEIILTQSAILTARAFRKGTNPSDILTEKFQKAITIDSLNPYFKKGIDIYPRIELLNQPHKRYSGTNSITLIDGIRATKSFVDKNWLGYQGENLTFIIDFGKTENLKKISLAFLRNQGSWIFLPKKIKYYKSDDTIHFIEVSELDLQLERNSETEIIDISKDFSELKTQYLKITVESIGDCPEWHSGNGNPAFFFIDEILCENNN